MVKSSLLTHIEPVFTVKTTHPPPPRSSGFRVKTLGVCGMGSTGTADGGICPKKMRYFWHLGVAKYIFNILGAMS